MLAALHAVDAVVPFDEDTPIESDPGASSPTCWSRETTTPRRHRWRQRGPRLGRRARDHPEVAEPVHDHDSSTLLDERLADDCGWVDFVDVLRGPATLLVLWSHLANSWPKLNKVEWPAGRTVSPVRDLSLKHRGKLRRLRHCAVLLGGAFLVDQQYVMEPSSTTFADGGRPDESSRRTRSDDGACGGRHGPARSDLRIALDPRCLRERTARRALGAVARYLLLNLAGSTILAVLAAHERQYGSSSWSAAGRWCRHGASCRCCASSIAAPHPAGRRDRHQLASGVWSSAASCAMTSWPAISRCRSGCGSGHRSSRAGATGSAPV